MLKKFDDNDIQELKDLVRIGIVSSVNSTKMTARVKIQDLGIVTGDLKIVQNTPLITSHISKEQGVKIYPWIPYIGQWVLCIFKPDGEGDGFVIGGI